MLLSDGLNEKRIMDRFEEINRYTEAEWCKGITRLPFTTIERQAFEKVREYMTEAGLYTYYDDFGNLFGRIEGERVDLPVVMTGSHIDTVIKGGAYDGVVGVLAAVEALQVIKESGHKPYYPLEAAVFVAEEPARFKAGALGSRALIGDLSQNDLLILRDRNGISLADALANCGYKDINFDEIRKTPDKIKSFIELHIEQSSRLEQAKKNIGLVSDIAASTICSLTLTGRASHAGATPMNLRQDAFMAAAEIAFELETLVTNIANEAVVTVGELTLAPNVINVIPATVVMGIDIRDICIERKQNIITQLAVLAETVSKKRRVKYDLKVVSEQRPLKTSEKLLEIVKEQAKKLSLSYEQVISGAFHDALNMGRITDVALIFIPSKDGISHSHEEYTDMNDILKGTKLLIETLTALSTT